MKMLKRFALPGASVLFGFISLVYFFKAGVSPVVLISALIMIANGVLQLLQKDEEGSKAKTLTVRTEEGESIIAIDALQGILRDELCKSKDVHDAKVSLAVNEENNAIACRISFKLDSQEDIPGRTDAQKRTVRDAFERLLPGSAALSITCQVDDILTSSAKSAVSHSQEAEAAFSGPVYPVANGEEDPI
ncbi:MAG: hypothetical protein ACYTGH_01390 [Planctomycetota bacterium]|jgi:hypothetical protein